MISDSLKAFVNAVISFLAPFIDTFKAANPAVFAIIQAVLFTLNYIASNLVEWGFVEAETNWFVWTAQIITWLLAALVGSRTFKYLKKETQEKRKI